MMETYIKNPVPSYSIHKAANGFLIETIDTDDKSANWYVFLKWDDLVNYLKTGYPKNTPPTPIPEERE